MNTFENAAAPGQESLEPKSRETLIGELLTLQSEAKRLQNLIQESGENAGEGVVLGSEEHKDFGYTAALEEVEEKIKGIEKTLNDMDEADAAQRKLFR